MNLDPAAALLLPAAISLLFAVSAVHKMTAFRHFVAVLADYQILPAGLTGAVAAGIVISEVSVVILVVSGRSGSGMYLAAVLLCGYTMAVAINLLRGRRDIDCGCSGPAASQTISGWLVMRNTVLIVITLVALLPAAQRTLIWVDWATLALGLAAASALYGAVNTLIASHLKLSSERESRLWKTP